MSIYNAFTMKVAMPVADLLTRQNMKKYLDFLIESQYWSREKIDEFQNVRLQALVKHSYRNVPYYRDLFDKYGISPGQIQCVSDLSMLPVLSKKDIREGIKSGDLIDSTSNLRKLEINNSSGSTGEPLQFYLNREASSIKKASAIRAWQWMGFQFGDRILRVSPLPRTGLIKKIQDTVTRTKYIQVSQTNEKEFEVITAGLNQCKPSILRSYPDPLYLLARYLKNNGIKPQAIKAINTTGSTLFEHYRKLIEGVFSCRIFDSFSCEGGAVVSQCPCSDLYHVSDEYAITEILNEDGRPVSMGRLITTDLWNYATPFIRYDTQDVVEKSENQCHCGRSLMAIKKIYGRSSDILITPGKQFLYANDFTGRFQGISGIDQYQIFQKSLSEIIIRIKPSESYDRDTETHIRRTLSSIIQESIDISIHLVDVIPLSASGKRRFLIRDDSVSLDI